MYFDSYETEIATAETSHHRQSHFFESYALGWIIGRFIKKGLRRWRGQ